MIPSTSVALGGVTAIVATGTGETVAVMLDVTPPTVALIVADPGFIAVTSPVGVTVAIVASVVAHVVA
ncbi:MAG TPA: hypothetical protein VJS39_09790, partial [Gemmatimonadaceae bacterium]|nr:hypothetical protein [Gemmatimonadaceae bacterium]